MEEVEIKRTKRIAKNTTFLFIRQVLLLIISLYTSRVVLDKLGVVDFGIYNTVAGFVLTLSFLKTTMANVTQRFLSIELGKSDYGKARQIFSVHTYIYIILVVIIFLLSPIGAFVVSKYLVIPPERLSSAIIVYFFSIGSLCFTILGIVFNSSIIAHENMKVFSYIGIVEGFFKLLIAFILSITPFDHLVVYGLLLLAVTITIQAYSAWYCKRKYAECQFLKCFERNIIKQTFQFIGWDMVNSVIFITKDQGLTILLNLFFGPVVNAARAVTQQVNIAINGFISNFTTSVKPQLVKSYASKEQEYLTILFFKSSKYSLYLIWMISLPVMLCASDILDIWLKDVPTGAEIYLKWILLESICATAISPMSTLTMASGRLRKYVISCNIVNLLVFPTCLILLTCGLDAESVFIVSFILRIAEAICALICTNEQINFGLWSYVRKVIAPLSFVMIISGMGTYFLCNFIHKGSISIIMTSFASLILSLVCIWTKGSTEGERQYVVKIIKQKIKIR